VKQEPQSGDQHQQQQQAAAALQLADMVLISSMAQTAFRALLINAPGATATAAGASAEGITQLIAEESAVLDLCQQLLPVAKQLHYKRRLRLVLQMLYSISSDNVRVKYFFSRIRRVQHIPQEQYLDALMMTAEKYDVRTLAPVEGATAVAALPGAMQHVCQLCSLLGVSSNQQQQGLQAAVNVAQGLQCGDGRVEGFWNDYEVSSHYSASSCNAACCWPGTAGVQPTRMLGLHALARKLASSVAESAKAGARAPHCWMIHS
jgi:hypothetical protein